MTIETEAPESEEEIEIVHRLVYSSTAVVEFSEQDLIDLLAGARASNERIGISGMLLFHSGFFIQALEGDREMVDSVYERIGLDERHDGKRILLREDGPRAFADWTMGFVKASDELLEAIDGLNDFFQEGWQGGAELTEITKEEIDEDLDAGERVRKILDQFREGRWRNAIEG